MFSFSHPPSPRQIYWIGGEAMAKTKLDTMRDHIEALAAELQNSDGNYPSRILIRTPGNGEWTVQGFHRGEQYAENFIVPPNGSSEG
jgi:ABC-type Fe3+-hydroxamate transport system substrate-binding protein